MNGRIARFSRIGAGLLAVLGLALVMSGQEQSPENHVGLVTDWTSRHLVFSPPSSPLVATQVAQDPRYWQQWARRNLHPVVPEAKIDPAAIEARENEARESETRDAESAEAENLGSGAWGFNHDPKALKKDWSTQMSTAAGMGDLNYPAKYSFSTSTASCNDFVVYNTGTNNVIGGTAGSYTGTFSSRTASPTGSMTITNSTTGFSITLLATTNNTFPNFDDNATGSTFAGQDEATDATNFVADVNHYGGAAQLNVTATTVNTGFFNNGVSITGNSAQALTFTAISISNLTTNTNTSGVAGSATATIIGYKNLYTGTCAGVPTVAFSYNTGGTVTTSPVISLDGTQIAFVQNTAANAAQLVLLKPSLTSGGTYNAPAAVNTASSAANYRSGCALPCMYAITFALDAGAQASDGNATSGSCNSTPCGQASSVWEDYAFDVGYVGDDDGYVHKFTGVFTGTPAEVVSAVAPIWPVPLAGGGTSANNSTPTTSPVLDESRNVLYIGDFAGRVDWINTTTAALTSSTSIGSGGDDLYDSPLVDPSSGTNGFVYQTVESNGTSSEVAQFAGKFASNASPTATKAVGTVGTFIYTGTFDNLYYSGATTGHLYVCGAADPTIYEIPITTATGALGTTVTLTTALTTTHAATCSSVTEAFNGTTDYIYTSVTTEGHSTGCSGTTLGCVVSYNTTAALTAASTTAGAMYSPGGTSGIIIDNFSSGGGSQIYFSPLGGGGGAASCGGSVNAGCAVQAAQGAGL